MQIAERCCRRHFVVHPERGAVLHFGLSLVTRADPREGADDLVWNRSDAKAVFTTFESPIWLDRTILSALLVLCMGGMIVWFW